MVRKGDLAANLERYGAAHPDAGYSHAEFFQPTYCLSDPVEAVAFSELSSTRGFEWVIGGPGQ